MHVPLYFSEEATFNVCFRRGAALRALSGLAPGQDKTRSSANGGKRQGPHESMEQMSRRLATERREQNRQEWINHCECMAKTHLKISEEWSARRADYLRMGCDGIAAKGGGG